MAENAEPYKETVKQKSYKGIEYEIVRTDDDTYTRGTGFENEFVLHIDGVMQTTASRIETRGYENPWIEALSRYAEAFIDGVTDGGPY